MRLRALGITQKEILNIFGMKQTLPGPLTESNLMPNKSSMVLTRIPLWSMTAVCGKSYFWEKVPI